MRVPAFTILIGPEGWRLIVSAEGRVEVHPLPGAGEQLDAEAAAGVAAEMRRHGYGGQAVALAIPSAWAFAASFSTDKLPRGNRHQAMLYRLEEQLPLAAEEFVADFVEGGGQALGVAVQVGRLEGILGELESAGVSIQEVCPAGLLALQSLSRPLQGAGRCFVAMAAQGEVELAGLDGGRIRRWTTLEPDPASLARAVQAELLLDGSPDRAMKFLSVGLDEHLRGPLTEIEEIELEIADGVPAVEQAARTAADVLAGRVRPWFNLRRDQLAPTDRLRLVRRPLAACVWLAVLVLLALIGGLLWRAQRYQHLADEGRTGEMNLYQQLYPGRAVPGGVRLRLESEWRQLAGLRGGPAEAPRQRSALDALRDVVAHLPGQVRLQILECRIDSVGFVLEGQARSHGEAETIAAELRRSAGLSVEPPNTERLAGMGVKFVLTGRILPLVGEEAGK